MEEEEAEFHHWLGKTLFFLFVGGLSGVLLYLGYRQIRAEDYLTGIPTLAASAIFWYPLYRLGRFHARKARKAE